MQYIIGLGNPTKKYKNTRHNIGLDMLFKLEKDVDSDKVRFIDLDCYMNESGPALKKILKNIKADSVNKNLLVIQDDLDQPVGKVKMTFGGNSGGHNGINSIYSIMGIKDYYRLKIGISPEVKVHKDFVSDFVLGKFSPEEKEKINSLYSKILEGVKLFIDREYDRAVETINKK